MKINAAHNFIIVTPVYEDLEACSKLFKELATHFADEVFVIAVDDGSVKQPLTITTLLDAGLQGAVLKLRRNVGHQRAIATGLAFASEHMHVHQNVVVMDSDGEDLPETISMLFRKLASSQADVVVAKRKSRVETFRFKTFYFFYKQFFSVMTGRSISFGNYMLLTYAAVNRLVSMQELSLHLAGAVLASKLRTAVCPLDRGPRYAGQTKMNFVGLCLHGFKGLMVFAEDVLVRVGIVSAFICAMAVCGALMAILLKVAGFSTPGWFSIALGILVLMFIQTGTLALMSLMLTGVVKSNSVAIALGYKTFIAETLLTYPLRSN